MLYARVHFRKSDIWKTVPVQFIKDIDPENVIKNRCYKVFDSIIKGDTPNRALERMEVISIVEDDSNEMVEAAYYRATVALIKDSKEELEAAIGESSTQRLKEAPYKLLTTSFDGDDGGALKNKRMSSSRCSQKNLPKKLKKFSETENKENLNKNKKKKANKNNKDKDSLEVAKQTNPFNEMVFQEAIRAKVTKYIGNNKTETIFSSDEHCDSDSSDQSFPSPTRVKKLEDDLNAANISLDQCRAMKKKLQEMLLKKEEEHRNCSKLESEFNALKTKYAVLRKMYDAKTEKLKPELEYQEKKKRELERNSNSIKEDCETLKNINKTKQTVKTGEEKETIEVAAGDKHEITKDGSKMQELGGEENYHKQNNSLSDEHDSTAIPASKYELHESIFMDRKKWDELLNLNFGEKGDSKFVKSILMKMFDAATLKESTVKGRIGSKKIREMKATGEMEQLKAPPALDINKLASISKCLVEKIKTEIDNDMTLTPEGKSHKLIMETRNRTKISKVNKMIRDKIKTLK